MSSTICALATPPGAGGIAVVRVSGPEAYAVVGEIFTPRHPKTKPRVEDVAAAEAAMDIEGLVAEALEGIERIWIDIEG